MRETTAVFRFSVALSFPGEHRDRVDRIATLLAKRLGSQRILYDKWHRAEFARPNLDVYLQELYRMHSELLVFFLCAEYTQKEWCGLEWRAGRDLLKQKENDRLMFLRLDNADIPGLFSIDGFLDITTMPDQRVVEAILNRLAAIAPNQATTPEEAVHIFRAQILPDIQSRCGRIRVLTMEQPIGLSKIYTEVSFLEKRASHLRKTREELIRDAGLETFDRFGLPTTGGERVSGLAVLARHRHVMIYGKPGAGKTTFLKRLAVECATGNFRPDLVPVFIVLKDFAESDRTQSLLGYISQSFGENTRENMAIRSVFRAGAGLILLDGLDEVRDRDFAHVRKAIEAFTAEFGNSVIVLTCRIAAREYLFHQFVEVEMADFDDGQIREFSSHWFASQGEVEKAHDFIGKLKKSNPVYELATSPLLLTLLCLVFQERNDFGDTRAELYREGIEILFRKWDAKRGIERDRPYGLTNADFEALLSDIAYVGFITSEYFFAQSHLEAHIDDYVSSRDLIGRDSVSAEAVLNSIESQVGLLVQRAAHVYSFSHLTFQEYLTARRIFKRRSLLNEIGPRILDKRWREVWLLLTTMADPDEIIPELKSWVDKSIRDMAIAQKYLAWCKEKAIAVESGHKQAALRALFFDMAADVSSRLANAIDGRIAQMMDVSVALDLALDVIADLSGLLGGATNAPAILDNARQRARRFYRVRCSPGRSQDLALDLDRALESCRRTDIRRALVRAVELSLDLARATTPKVACSGLNVGLEDLRSEIASSKNCRNLQEWQNWRKKFFSLAKPRRIGRSWHFAPKDADILNDYYRANLLLIDCMDAARGLSHSIRKTVEDTMLLPST